MKPHVIVLSGYGLNCEDETKHAFELAGGIADVVHINDLAASKKLLKKYQIMAIPGGFSYGDDTGSGKAYANKMNNHLRRELSAFLAGDHLMIGICNGFQILTNLGLLPGALLPNASARYLDRWVDIEVSGESPWLTGISRFSVPIAHGEGRYYVEHKTLENLKKKKEIAFRYVKGDVCTAQDLPANPNGAMENIAAITGYEGRVLGIMPHPERAMYFTQLPDWTLRKEEFLRKGEKLPQYGPGLAVFKNAINYFR